MRQTGWYTIDEAAEAMARSRRSAIDLLKNLPEDLVREVYLGKRGRPRKLYHAAAHPALRAHYLLLGGPDQSEPSAAAPAPGRSQAPAARRVYAPDELAVARLRARAVMEYMERRHLTSEAIACRQTCEDWQIRPRSQQVEIVERIGRHQRKLVETVTLGAFAPTTLRHWYSLYKENREITALAPGRKHRCGREEVAIPEHLVDQVHAAAVSTARADVAKAVELVRSNYPGSFPEVSLSTWRRRIRARDPDKSSATLGKRGIQAFRAAHSPDILRDYSDLPWNGLWQLDDVTEDFYGHGAEADKLIRPFAYAIIRVPTRGWVAAIATQTPIAQDQVRTLLGLALASRAGGIPDAIQFERGRVACDEYLHELLQGLGIRVLFTSMDGGSIFPGAIADEAGGHFQGKGVIEANLRNHHDRLWDARAGTGPEERHTAHANLEPLKELARRKAAAGEFLVLPTPAQWQARIFQALEEHNVRPHSGLLQIVDPQTGQPRYMSPAECAQHKRKDVVRVMDERLLPLFYQRGLLVPVTRNGFTLNEVRYGAFDPGLQTLAGTKVTAYALQELPDVAYVVELGRCVEAARPVAFGAEGDLIERKRAIERTARNQFEALIQNAMAGEKPAIVQQTRILRNPVPDRAMTVCAPDVLLTRAQDIRSGAGRLKADRAALEARFKTSSQAVPDAGACRTRRGLLSREAEVSEDLVALGAGTVGAL